MAITKENIFEAANAIQATGVKPTMALVREKLGGGSLSTISPALREWADSNNKAVTVIVDIPPEVKSILDKMSIEIWRSLSTITNDKILRIETETTNAINEAIKDKEIALSEILNLEAQIEKLLSCKTQLEQKNKTLEIQIEKQQVSMDSQASQINELKLVCNNALLAEKTALEKAATLSGKIEFILSEKKQLQPKPRAIKTKTEDIKQNEQEELSNKKI